MGETLRIGRREGVDVHEDQHRGAQAVREDLDMCAWAFAAGGAGGGEGDVGFDVSFHFCRLGAEEEEDAEQGERSRPWVDGVDDCGCYRS